MFICIFFGTSKSPIDAIKISFIYIIDTVFPFAIYESNMFPPINPNYNSVVFQIC